MTLDTDDDSSIFDLGDGDLGELTLEDPFDLSIEARWRGLSLRLRSFVLERHPFALGTLTKCMTLAIHQLGKVRGSASESIEALRAILHETLLEELEKTTLDELADPTPGVTPLERLAAATEALVIDVDGFVRREAIRASFNHDERREMLAGMLLTRAVDNRLKQFFTSGEIRFGHKAFQGKGFRSLGQEAIYAACLRLRRGDEFRTEGGDWRGDVVAPLIRDVGAALAMDPDPETVRMVLSAQMGKAGPPMDGRDLHIGNLDRGILPPAAPLSISALTVAGLAYAMAQESSAQDSGAATEDEHDEGSSGSRVAVTFIGEGGSSLGEWHEAINACAAMRLPAIFCIENNQTALSTPVPEQSAARTFADKAAGYGIPGLTVDGTDPEAIAAAFTWAARAASMFRAASSHNCNRPLSISGWGRFPGSW